MTVEIGVRGGKVMCVVIHSFGSWCNSLSAAPAGSEETR